MEIVSVIGTVFLGYRAEKGVDVFEVSIFHSIYQRRGKCVLRFVILHMDVQPGIQRRT
jgi:hypothetical protein